MRMAKLILEFDTDTELHYIQEISKSQEILDSFRELNMFLIELKKIPCHKTGQEVLNLIAEEFNRILIDNNIDVLM